MNKDDNSGLDRNAQTTQAAAEQPADNARRRFLSNAALFGVAGAGVALVGCKQQDAPAGAATAPAASTAHTAHTQTAHHMAPGQLDSYYGLWSGGHSGEARVLGFPSGRELKRIPVFAPDAMSGWGITNESKAIMGTRADGSLEYTTGDTHHVHQSYKDGTYDGKYAWINDKIHGRIARIRLDTFDVDKITTIPNIQGFHGIFPDKRDPVDPAINHTTRVFCGAEFSIPLPNNGKDAADASKYWSLFTCVDAETMAVRWQVRINGNCDLVATSFDGKLAATNQYNTEMGATYVDMMSAEQDACLFFNIARIEQAIKDGKFTKLPGSDVPLVDGTREANADAKTALVCYVPVPKNPHGVNASPDGKYFICSGKLSPTASVIALEKVLGWFDGSVANPRDAVVAEPELGLGPLHTAFDGRGNAFTTLFLDSQIVKWNVDAAIKHFSGDKSASYVVDRLDVFYQPGHLNASMSETREADGKYLAVGCKFSKDRFLPVGPLHPENEHIIDISGEKMVLLADHPVYPEPHDFIIFRADIIRAKKIYELDSHPLAVKSPDQVRVERKGNKVTAFITSTAPFFTPNELVVKKGDEVTVVVTNLDNVEDLTHGFAIPKHNINFIIHPQQTVTATFVADKPGIFWAYCTHFCHALHLEMRMRLIVEA